VQLEPLTIATVTFLLAEALGCPVPRALLQSHAALYESAPPRSLARRLLATRSIAGRHLGSAVP